MFHKHRHGIKQTLFSSLVFLIIGGVLYFGLRANLFSKANGTESYKPTTGVGYEMPDANSTDQKSNSANKKYYSNKKRYIVAADNLPIYYVTDVIDGNTIVLEGNKRVRLAGIKAPNKDEELGLKALEFLEKEVGKKDVYFQEDDKNPKDDLGRYRGIIYVDGKNINIELVRNGFAHIYPVMPSIIAYDAWDEFVNEAREAKRGLWSEKTENEENSIKDSITNKIRSDSETTKTTEKTTTDQKTETKNTPVVK